MAQSLQKLSDDLRNTAEQQALRVGSADLAELAQTLRHVAEQLASGEPEAGPSGRARNRVGKKSDLIALARGTYLERRRRMNFFDAADLFGEPAWDILLDLFVARLEGVAISVTSACIGSAVPPTTGLRWLTTLEDAGLVYRESDPSDQRRILVRISEEGERRMRDYFQSAPPLS